MALRLIQIGNSLPHSFISDITDTYVPGSPAQIKVMTGGAAIVVGKSDGTAPIGIIDDIKSNNFFMSAWDEVVIAPVPNPVLNSQGQLVAPYDIKIELDNPNVIPDTFISLDLPVQLIPRNGVIVFMAGSVLNFDATGSGIPNALRTVVRYAYTVPNTPGDDSTLGSGMVTVWFQRMIVEVDTFDPTANYPVNANLFISETGLFTTKQYAPDIPSVGLVIAPPSPIMPTLQLLWL